jgi:hypothetical protein
MSRYKEHKQESLWEEIAPGYFLSWDRWKVTYYITGPDKRYKLTAVDGLATVAQARKAAIASLKRAKLINPGDKWIRAKAIRFNKNGSVSIRK